MTARVFELIAVGLSVAVPMMGMCLFFRRRYQQHMRLAKQTLDFEVEKRTRLLAQAIDELQLQKTQLSLITDALPAAIAYFDSDLILKFHNHVYRRWLGFPEDKTILGLHYKKLVGADVYQIVEPRIVAVLRGEPVNYEYVLPDHRRTIDVNYVPDLDQNGQVRGYVVLASDIGHFKEIQENLIRAKEEAEAANQAKTRFLANMSHEIRTPLGAILGFSELLRVNSLQSPNQEYVEAIRRNGSILSKVINDILDISKIEAERLDLEITEVSVREVVGDIQSLVGLKAQEKGISLQFTIAETVPEFIRTDHLRLRQVLLNVVSNAVKFTNRGVVDVQVGLDPTHQTLLSFEVRDTGIGISESQRAKLFEPFQQADASLTRKFGGTGLGLVLAKKLAQRLGGDVVLAFSELDSGSTFRVTVDPGPAVLSQSSREQTNQRARRKLEVNQDLKGIEVLLVDDSPDNRFLVRLFLEIAGASVALACDGQEAVDMAQKKNFDVILMDLQMPKMDGFEAATILRSRGFHGPLIAVTAHVFREELQKCVDVGFDGHLSKPIDWQTLIETILRFKTSPTLASPSAFQQCE